MYRKIKGWTDIQQLYMPEVSVLRVRGEREVADSANEIPSYDIALHLPSSLPLRMRTSQKLFEYEFRLRTAQAYEALDEIRGHLRLRTHMYQYKDRNIVGQRANTRSRTLLSRVQVKVNASAKKYTCARNALTALAERTGTVGWDTQLRELSDEDIRAFTDDTEKEREKKGKNLPGKKGKDARKKALGEGHKMLSWIWKVVGIRDDGDDAGVQEGMYAYTMHSGCLLTFPLSTSHRMVQGSCALNALVRGSTPSPRGDAQGTGILPMARGLVDSASPPSP